MKNLQDVLEAEKDLLKFAAAFRSAKDLADAIAAAKSVVIGIDEYEKKLDGLKAEYRDLASHAAAAKREASEAKAETDRAKDELARVRAELSNLASKLFGRA